MFDIRAELGKFKRQTIGQTTYDLMIALRLPPSQCVFMLPATTPRSRNTHAVPRAYSLQFTRWVSIGGFALMAVGLAFGQTVNTNHWTVSGNATVMRSPLGKSFTRLQLASDKSKIAEMSLSEVALAPDKQSRLSLSYRTTAKTSRQDRGAWLLILYFDGNKKPVGTQVAVFGCTSAWLEELITLTPPKAAASAGLHLRLQEEAGTFDLENITLSTQPVQIATDPAPPEADYVELAAYTLSNEAGKPRLLSSNPGLPSIEMYGDRFPMGFTLPDSLCGNPRLQYEVTTQFSPDFNTARSKDIQTALFSLGRNMTGAAEGDSFSLMFWGDGLLTRLTSWTSDVCTTLGKAELKLVPGQACEARIRWNATKLEYWWNGENQGVGQLTQPFSWPARKTFWIGGETQSGPPFKGKITGFNLRVLKPRLTAEFSEGNAGGYFFGTDRCYWGIHFPDQNGDKIHAEYWISGEAGQLQTEKPMVILTDASECKLQLPHLPLGWYELHARLQSEGASTEIKRSFVVCPPVLSRKAALANPCGIQSAFKLSDRSHEDAAPYFLRTAQAGMAWWRLWLRWDDIQNTPAEYHWKGLDDVVAEAEKNGLRLYLNITGGAHSFQKTPWAPGEKWGVMSPGCFAPADRAAWKRFLTALATRYKGRIPAYQIWNEPDARNGLYPFDPRVYVSILQDSAAALRAADPQALIGLGGFCAALSGEGRGKTNFNQNSSAWPAGAFYRLNPQDYYDIVDCHFYSISEPGQSWDRVYEDVKQTVRYLQTVGEDKKSLWDSEVSMYSGRVGQNGGWANVPCLSENQQANELIKLHVQSLAAGVSRTFWFGFTGDIGIVNDNLSPKPAYAAQAFLSSALSGATFLKALPLSANYRAYAFAKDGGYLTVAWTLAGTGYLSPASRGNLQSFDRRGNRLAIKPGTAIPLSTTPVYFMSEQPVELQELVSLQASPGNPHQIEVSLFNPGPSPAHFRLGLSTAITSSPPREITLAAGEKQKALFDSSGFSGTVELEAMATGGFEQPFDLTLELPRYQRLDLTAGQPVQIAINRADQLLIGGAATDLQNRILTPAAWKGPQDSSLTLKWSLEGDRVTFSIRVMDDIIVPAPANEGVWNGDAVELFLDFGRKGGTAHKYQPCVGADGRIQAPGDKLPPGFTATAQRTSTGYAIAGSFKITAEMPDEIGLDVALDDADDSSGRKSQSFWLEKTAGQGETIGLLRIRKFLK